MRLPLPRWPLGSQVGERAQLMDRVMRAVGGDPCSVVRRDGGKAYAQARATCLDCRHGRECASALDAGMPLPADFCPNADFFQAARVARPARSHRKQ